MQRSLLLLASTVGLLACSSPGGGGGPLVAGDTVPGDIATADVAIGDTAVGGLDVPSDTGPPPFVDEDFDDIPDPVDNCVGLFNPFQDDSDLDGIGDICDPDGGDSDGDRVPDSADLFPDDPNMPGTVRPNTVYAHTSSELYYLGVKTLEVFRIGAFQWPAGLSGSEMTDIAIDRYGVLYGVSFDDYFTCHPDTAICTFLAPLPARFNGLTLVPKGVIDQENDTLVGIAGDGGWWKLAVVNGNVQSTFLGEYGGTYSSSGDAFSIEGVGTFASVNKGSFGSDVLVQLDPLTGSVTSEITTLTGYSSVFGLAGWADQAYAFDSNGTVIIIDLTTNTVQSTKQTGKAWWGAGVRTRLDP